MNDSFDLYFLLFIIILHIVSEDLALLHSRVSDKDKEQLFLNVFGYSTVSNRLNQRIVENAREVLRRQINQLTMDYNNGGVTDGSGGRTNPSGRTGLDDADDAFWRPLNRALILGLARTHDLRTSLYDAFITQISD